LIQKGERYRVIPMTAEIEAILRPLRDHHKIHVFTFVARRTRKDRWGNKFIRGERYPVTSGVSRQRVRAIIRRPALAWSDFTTCAALRRSGWTRRLARRRRRRCSATTRIYLRRDTDVEKLRAQMEARDAYLDELRAKTRGMNTEGEGAEPKTERK
jgi:hypothetical protein